MRRTIHSSLTPIRAATSAFVTTVRGRLAPTDAIAAPYGRAWTTVSAVAKSVSMAGIVVLMVNTFVVAAGDANGPVAQTRHAGGSTGTA